MGRLEQFAVNLPAGVAAGGTPLTRPAMIAFAREIDAVIDDLQTRCAVADVERARAIAELEKRFDGKHSIATEEGDPA